MSETLKEFKIAVGLDTKELTQSVRQSESILKSFGKVAGGIFASYLGYEALKNTIFGFTELADKIGHTSKMMGYSMEETHALGNALKRFGGNTDSAMSSLNSLSGALQDAKFGGGALIDVARKYGIQFMESNGKLMSAENLLKSLGKQMQGYDKLTQMEIGKKLGLDDSLILALQDGGVELERLIKRQKELGVITQRDYDLAQEFGNAWEELKESFKAISMQIARTLMPVLKKVIDGIVGFIDYLRKHKALVIGFFAGLAIALAPILAQFIAIAGASITAFAPLYAVVGVVTAIALVAEDIWVYFQGGDSVVGELAKKFPIIGSLLEGIRPIVMGIVEAFKDIVKWLENPSWEGLLDIFKKWGNAIYTYLKEPIDSVKRVFDTMFLDVKNWLQDPSWGGLVDIFKKWGDAIYEYFKKPLDYIKSLITDIGGSIKNFIADSWIGGLLGMEKQPQISSSQPTSNTTNNYNVNASVNQNITSATPKALADQTSSAIIDSINSQRQMIGAN